MTTLLFAANIYWHLPVLIAVISVVYSATRYDDWDRIWHETRLWGVRMVVFLGNIAVILYLLSSFEFYGLIASGVLVVIELIVYRFLPNSQV